MEDIGIVSQFLMGFECNSFLYKFLDQEDSSEIRKENIENEINLMIQEQNTYYIVTSQFYIYIIIINNICHSTDVIFSISTFIDKRFCNRWVYSSGVFSNGLQIFSFLLFF